MVAWSRLLRNLLDLLFFLLRGIERNLRFLVLDVERLRVRAGILTFRDDLLYSDILDLGVTFAVAQRLVSLSLNHDRFGLGINLLLSKGILTPIRHDEVIDNTRVNLNCRLIHLQLSDVHALLQKVSHSCIFIFEA